ncbi:hypothetical protein TNCV_2419231 [Trichonephila clavipes]|nr:hypothetical protein TNCV_2419231 [Trichonephila clavipes]
MPRTILELASFNYDATPTRGRLNWLLLTTTPLQQEDVRALDRFNVHLSPTWRVFSSTGLELVTPLMINK